MVEKVNSEQGGSIINPDPKKPSVCQDEKLAFFNCRFFYRDVIGCRLLLSAYASARIKLPATVLNNQELKTNDLHIV